MRREIPAPETPTNKLNRFFKHTSSPKSNSPISDVVIVQDIPPITKDVLKDWEGIIETEPKPRKKEEKVIDYLLKVKGNHAPQEEKIPVIKSEFSQKPRSERKGEFIGFCIRILVGGILVFSGVLSAGSYFTAEKLTGLVSTFIYTYQFGTLLSVVGIIVIYDTIRWRKST